MGNTAVDTNESLRVQSDGALHERFAWLDDARGLMVLILVISFITTNLSGDLLTGEPPLGPTFLSHGYAYYNGWPPMITGIDAGQPVFMFMLGFVGYIAFTSRWRKRGATAAWIYALRRFALLFVFGFVQDCLLRTLDHQPIQWNDVLFDGTLPKLAWGTLAAFACIMLLRNADYRAWFAALILAAHAVLYVFPLFDHHTWTDDVLRLPFFPFGLVSHLAIAILGSCFGQWYYMDPADPKVGMRRRIFPVTVWAGVGTYCFDWIIPAQHHDMPLPLALMAVTISGLMIVGFYSGYSMGLRFPLLSALGKNLLLMFALSWFVADKYLSFLDDDMLRESPFLALALAGLLPIVVLALIAKILERYNIIIRA